MASCLSVDAQTRHCDPTRSLFREFTVQLLCCSTRFRDSLMARRHVSKAIQSFVTISQVRKGLSFGRELRDVAVSLDRRLRTSLRAVYDIAVPCSVGQPVACRPPHNVNCDTMAKVYLFFHAESYWLPYLEDSNGQFLGKVGAHFRWRFSHREQWT